MRRGRRESRGLHRSFCCCCLPPQRISVPLSRAQKKKKGCDSLLRSLRCSTKKKSANLSSFAGASFLLRGGRRRAEDLRKANPSSIRARGRRADLPPFPISLAKDSLLQPSSLPSP
ncbi:hypothetical protein C4D60_Mb05t17250 [Musa balbisiana]|uniref:Uncharacterized protein n=1 Tax=Musa balbisiana TaxID=52838 RepID=A0A4S8JWT2_MUSBA|nr:hypothetical protein C4D60_Mb05t17250 [Musa balbisiana]